MLTLTSTGDSPLIIDSVDIADLENNRTRYFGIASTDCQQRTLNVGEHCQITVSFFGAFPWADIAPVPPSQPSSYNVVEVWSNAPLPLPGSGSWCSDTFDPVGPASR